MKSIKFLTLLFFGLFPIVAIAQDDNVRGIVRTERGYLVVWNQPKNNFCLHAIGKVFEKIPNENIAFLVDGNFLQITAAFKKDFLTSDQKKQGLEEPDILLAHRDWESNYLGQVLKEKLKIDSEPIKLSTNKDALLWSFLVPENSKGEVKKQIFLTVVNDESVIVLNGAVTSKFTEAMVRQFLLTVAITVKPSKNALSREDAVKLAWKYD